MNPKFKEWKVAATHYAEHWGFRPGSGVAMLIHYLRDTWRVKYGLELILHRVGKNTFEARVGSRSDFGVSYALEYAKYFAVTVIKEKK